MHTNQNHQQHKKKKKGSNRNECVARLVILCEFSQNCALKCAKTQLAAINSNFLCLFREMLKKDAHKTKHYDCGWRGRGEGEGKGKGGGAQTCLSPIQLSLIEIKCKVFLIETKLKLKLNWKRLEIVSVIIQLITFNYWENSMQVSWKFDWKHLERIFDWNGNWIEMEWTLKVCQLSWFELIDVNLIEKKFKIKLKLKLKWKLIGFKRFAQTKTINK